MRPTAFLDRDGTVIVERHYLGDPAGVTLLPGAAEGLRRLSAVGVQLVLVTNQSGVARGYFTEEDMHAVHMRLSHLLAEEGVTLDAIFTCPHHPDANCACRKPRVGMLEQARRELSVDWERSAVIGDKPCDIEMGRAAGLTTILVRTGYGANPAGPTACKPDWVVDTLDEAATRLLHIWGQTEKPPTQQGSNHE